VYFGINPKGLGYLFSDLVRAAILLEMQDYFHVRIADSSVIAAPVSDHLLTREAGERERMIDSD